MVVVGALHGASMHDELALLVAAGMSPEKSLADAPRIQEGFIAKHTPVDEITD